MLKEIAVLFTPELLIGVLLGGFVGTLTSWFFAWRGSHDGRALIEEAKTAGLTVADLRDALRNRIIDPNAGGPFPIKLCPVCGSENIEHHTESYGDVEGMEDDGSLIVSGGNVAAITCRACGWSRSELDGPKAFEI